MKRFLGVLIALIITYYVFGDNRDKIKWWLYYYGDYSETVGKNDPRMQRVFTVFERVKEVADKVASQRPRLFIIKTRSEPFAFALPDGSIVIHPKTLDICYTDVDKETGDQRAAFILGHELAHLSNKDFMHREAFQALEKYGNQKSDEEITPIFEISCLEKAKLFKKKELMADKMGALYASMAGYDISGLFGKESNFLSYWANQVGIGNLYDIGISHPSFEKRLQFIRTQLNKVLDQLELFKAGVLLYQMGNYHDGVDAFFEFSKTYPSREVFNNIGACYFNLALKRLFLINENVFYRFRISTTIEHATHAESLMQLRGDEHYLKDPLFSRYMNKTEEYFRLAVEGDSQNKTSRCNLAAALILKGEYARAQAECDHILQTHPKNARVLNNKAIAFYYYGKKHDVDTAQKAIQMLHEAHKKYKDHADILYNLASLKEQRERLAGAKLYWEKYLTISPKDNYYNHIYMKLNGTSPPAARKISTRVPDPPIGVRIRGDISKIEKKWGNENAEIRKYRLGSEGEKNQKNNTGWALDMKVIVKDNVRVVGLDGTVEVVEYKIKPSKDAKKLIDRLGEPVTIVRHTRGNFYVYKDKGYSFKEVNGKVKAYIWFEKKF
jgi:tetratricopeptide (TPR) repeat protein